MGVSPESVRVHNAQCTMHNAQCSMDNAQCSMDNAQWTRDNAQGTRDKGQGTRDNAQFAIPNSQLARQRTGGRRRRGVAGGQVASTVQPLAGGSKVQVMPFLDVGNGVWPMVYVATLAADPPASRGLHSETVFAATKRAGAGILAASCVGNAL